MMKIVLSVLATLGLLSLSACGLSSLHVKGELDADAERVEGESPKPEILEKE